MEPENETTTAHIDDLLPEDPRKSRPGYKERLKYFGAEAVERFDEQAKQKAAKKRERKAGKRGLRQM